MRAAKRIKLADQEVTESKAEHVETQEVAAKTDGELFVLDTTAVLPSSKQQEKKEKKAKDPRRNPSIIEQDQIDKLVQQHTVDDLRQLIKQGKTISKRATHKGSVQPNFDLWGAGIPTLKGGDKAKKLAQAGIKPVIGSALAGTKPAAHVDRQTRPALHPKATSKAVTIEVARSGQSYNPDKVLHKKILQEAVDVEKKRRHAEIEAKAPISTGMSEETKKYLLGSDSEESDNEDDANIENGPGVESVERVQRKLTRAERNKQKRLRAEQKEIESRKRQKKIQNAVAEAKVITKQLTQQEREQIERREEAQKLKATKERTKGQNVYSRLSDDNPIHAPTYPVALSSELKQTGGSLRTIRPKGSLLTDRMASFADRDMIAKKQVKKKRRVEGKRRKMRIKVRGKGHAESKEGQILG